MPSYVNIGAWVGPGTMVDTWATVGSCAQIGADVHLSGGVGIGGVLEPPQATPVIIEDGAFIGSRCVVVEGRRRRRGGRARGERRDYRVDADHRRHGVRSGRAQGCRPTSLRCCARCAPEGIPSGHVPAAGRADHRAAHRVDRPQDEPQRRVARFRRRRLTRRPGRGRRAARPRGRRGRSPARGRSALRCEP